MLLPRNSSRTSTQAMSVPSTAFTTTTISEATSVSFSAATRLRVGDGRPEAVPAVLGGAPDHRRERDQRDHAQVARRPCPRRGRPPGRAALEPPREARRGCGSAGGSRTSPGSAKMSVDDAALRVEELVVHLAPAAELRDLEQVRRRRVLGLVHERSGSPSGSRCRRRSSAPRRCAGSRGTPSPPSGASSWSPPPGSRSGSSGRARRSRGPRPSAGR